MYFSQFQDDMYYQEAFKKETKKVAIKPIIQLGFNDETNQLVLNTESTDAIALLEVLVQAQTVILRSIAVPTPEQIIKGKSDLILP